MKIRIGDEILTEHIRVKVRLDYRGEGKNGRFILGGKSREQMAEQVREQQVALLRNVPFQGVSIEDIDLSIDVYTMIEEDRKSKEVAYAPIILILRVENVEDLMPLLLKPEFRKIEFLSPENLTVHRLDLERMLYRVSQTFQQELRSIENKLLR